jgi:hypothetical protein
MRCDSMGMLPLANRLERRRTMTVLLCSLSAYQASAGDWERHANRISCSANRAEERKRWESVRYGTSIHSTNCAGCSRRDLGYELA